MGVVSTISPMELKRMRSNFFNPTYFNANIVVMLYCPIIFQNPELKTQNPKPRTPKTFINFAIKQMIYKYVTYSN